MRCVAELAFDVPRSTIYKILMQNFGCVFPNTANLAKVESSLFAGARSTSNNLL